MALTDHPLRHLRGLHCNEETKWRERGDRLGRLSVLLTQVTSTTTLIVAVAQLWGLAIYIKGVSSALKPWVLFESVVAHLNTLVQNIYPLAALPGT